MDYFSSFDDSVEYVGVFAWTRRWRASFCTKLCCFLSFPPQTNIPLLFFPPQTNTPKTNTPLLEKKRRPRFSFDGCHWRPSSYVSSIDVTGGGRERGVANLPSLTSPLIHSPLASESRIRSCTSRLPRAPMCADGENRHLFSSAVSIVFAVLSKQQERSERAKLATRGGQRLTQNISIFPFVL